MTLLFLQDKAVQIWYKIVHCRGLMCFTLIEKIGGSAVSEDVKILIIAFPLLILHRKPCYSL